MILLPTGAPVLLKVGTGQITTSLCQYLSSSFFLVQPQHRLSGAKLSITLQLPIAQWVTAWEMQKHRVGFMIILPGLDFKEPNGEKYVFSVKLFHTSNNQ